ncbi:MAG: 2OG-Fe(II) oxygenase [Candidatus Sulfotelmatobacter sp.]
MTPKQILDSFSETLVRDERILSPQERALVATLLQHAKAAPGENPQMQEAVRAVIASAIGETVAQRAFAVLGGSIVERILEGSTLPQADSAIARTVDTYAGPHPPLGPQPPGELRATAAETYVGPHPPLGPQPPSLPLRRMGEPDPPSVGPQPGPGVRAPQKAPQPPNRPMGEPDPPSGQPHPGPGVRAPQKAPQPPGRPMGEPDPPSGQPHPGPGVRAPRTEPDPPSHHTRTTVVSEANVGVEIVERPAELPAKCVVLDEFLAPAELANLTRFVLEHEADFTASTVVSPRAEEGEVNGEISGVINYDHRRSRVLMDLAQHQDVMLDRIKSVLPLVLDQLGMEEFAIADAEAQVTASNDGDFFHFHSDNGSERVASRHLTFVYFFHREPRQFEGGELRIHDSRLQDGVYVSEGSYQTIVPQQNQIVFFPCELLHEITPVNCSSQLFADGRFTLNGWLRR